MATRLSAGLSGTAGEFFVAAELSRKGYVASFTARNTKGIDILAANTDATKTVGIQVKTNQGGKEWVLKARAEKDTAENLFYVFVRLRQEGLPDFYVVPRSEVAKYARDNHRSWLRTPGRSGQLHKDNDMRKFADPTGVYKDGWNRLGLG